MKKASKPTKAKVEKSSPPKPAEEALAQTPAEALNANEKKWGKRLLKAKFTVMPNVIFERQLALKLDAVDINILLHLVSYWWTAESKPRPAKSTIAEAMKLSPRTIQRHIARLEKFGYIKRERRFIRGQGSQPNAYHFDGLIAAALPLAEEKIKDLQKRQRERDERNGRRKAFELASI